jgi:hypothetical protein
MDARRQEVLKERDERRLQEQLSREQIREERKMRAEDDAARWRTGR